MENYLRLQRLLMGIKDSYCKGNAAELSRSIKKDPSYVNRLFYPAGKKGAKGIGPDIMQACKDAFPLPKGFWDMQPEEAFPTGTGKTEGSSASQAQEPQAQRKAAASIASRPNIEATTPGEVPVVSWVQAGDWCGVVDNFQPGDAEDWLPCPVRHGRRTYALVVRGLSMYDPTGRHSFRDGDTIFVDPDRGADHRSLVIARLDDEKEATFKQLLIEGDQRMLQALNPSWPNRIIPINGNCTMCGVVIGKLESFI